MAFFVEELKQAFKPVNESCEYSKPYNDAKKSADKKAKEKVDAKNPEKVKINPTGPAKEDNTSEPKNESLLKEGWRGCSDIEMVSHGSWGDPDLVYDGCTFNYWDIEDALWYDFLEDSEGKWTDSDSDNPECEKEFNAYVQEHGASYLDDVIAGGYFDEGSDDWHDRYNESVELTEMQKYKEKTGEKYWDSKMTYPHEDAKDTLKWRRGYGATKSQLKDDQEAVDHYANRPEHLPDEDSLYKNQKDIRDFNKFKSDEKWSRGFANGEKEIPDYISNNERTRSDFGRAADERRGQADRILNKHRALRRKNESVKRTSAMSLLEGYQDHMDMVNDIVVQVCEWYNVLDEQDAIDTVLDLIDELNAMVPEDQRY